MSHLRSREGELKSQGAVEAAQDSSSKLTAQDAENVMANESKKAGIPALQFDPDATPEEKAAQARSVSSSQPFRSNARPNVIVTACTGRLSP